MTPADFKARLVRWRKLMAYARKTERRRTVTEIMSWTDSICLEMTNPQRAWNSKEARN